MTFGHFLLRFIHEAFSVPPIRTSVGFSLM